ncbi:MAG: sulfatase activating formylglycine-generating enzyme [Saprospiraceae bacterium]|jgi:formylglycine-generating enzyme required for sulfatase activity
MLLEDRIIKNKYNFNLMIRVLGLLFGLVIANFVLAQQPLDSIQIPGTETSFSITLIPGGAFTMGSDETDEQRDVDEGPQFEVSIDSFWMGTYEVSFDEYFIFREKELDMAIEENPDWDADAVARPSPPYEDPTFGMGENGFPASSMTQFGALQYCKWLSEKSGDFYRLPTEAEWEYACKAGHVGSSYYNATEENLDDHSWHYDNSTERFHKIGTKTANPWGLFDMLGNVSEWTLDQYTADAYTTLDEAEVVDHSPWLQPTKLHPRTVRGGSWDDKQALHRCTCRIESERAWKERDPQIPKSFWWNTDSPFVGFRIIKPVNQPTQEERDAFWGMVLGG